YKVGDVLMAQGKLDEALKANRDSLSIVEQLAAADPSNAQWQNSLRILIGQIGEISYRFVLAGKFARGLAAADQAIAIMPDELWLHANRAHALMFIGRIKEARALYLKYRGLKNVQGDKLWDAAIIDDFAEMREAGRMHAL